MPEYMGPPLQKEPTPEPVCTFTANVNCLTCSTALLGSWRADEGMAPAATKVFSDFRDAHVPHDGFREGPPCIGMHADSDVPPPGQTLVSTVGCCEDPNNPGHLKFSRTAQNLLYSIYDQ